MSTKDWNKAMSEWGVKSSPDLSIVKSKYKPKDPPEGVRALMYDPLSLQNAMGFKDRRSSLTYDILKRIPQQLAVIAAVIQTRCHQVSSFSTPYRLTKSLGFEIKHRNPAHVSSKGDREKIQSLETFIYNCGALHDNPHNKFAIKRDDFETFLKKIVRDSLQYDQACWEIVPNHRGEPFEFMAVDASTIRIASHAVDNNFMDNWHDRDPVSDMTMADYRPGNPLGSNPYRLAEMKAKNLRPAYVQVINGQVAEVFTKDELAFGIRNPRSDIQVQGYGYSELEQLISVITAHLHAEEYNRRFFTQGSSPKGILTLKGDSMGPEMLEDFRRMWRANVEGVENAWRTPIFQSEQGIDWTDLHRSNSDMEYSQWVEYLLKITCAVYMIDPAELNFDMHGGVSQTPLFESSQEWKLKASRDKGLKPMLRFIAKMINTSILSKIDDDFVFDFVGLDELTEQEKHELSVEQLSSYMTLNEIRRSKDLPDIEYGDVPLNPTYSQIRAGLLAEETQKQQMEMQGQSGGDDGDSGGDKIKEDQGPSEDGEESQAPAYADRFTKSIDNNVKVLEVSLDDETWVDMYREVTHV